MTERVCNGAEGGVRCLVHRTYLLHDVVPPEETPVRDANDWLRESVAFEPDISAADWLKAAGADKELTAAELAAKERAIEVVRQKELGRTTRDPAYRWAVENLTPDETGERILHALFQPAATLLDPTFIPEYVGYVRRFGADMTTKIARLVGTNAARVKRFAAEHPLGPTFLSAVKAADEEYRQDILHSLIDRGIEGFPEPIFNKEGRVVGERRKFPEALALRILQKLDPAYRDKSEVGVNVKSSGVLVVQNPANSVEAWKQLASTAQTQPKEPTK